MTSPIKKRVTPVREPETGSPTMILTSAIVAGDNDRTVFEDEPFKTLCDSIKAKGLMFPITIRARKGGMSPIGEKYEIIAGERRWRAHKALFAETGDLKFAYIKALIVQANDQEADDLMLIENLVRKDLNPVDEANAYAKRMKRWNLTVEEIAMNYGVGMARVSSRLKLLSLRPELQSLAGTGQLPLGHAETIGKLDNNRQYLLMNSYRGGTLPPLDVVRDQVAHMYEDQVKEQQQAKLFGDDPQPLVLQYTPAPPPEPISRKRSVSVQTPCGMVQCGLVLPEGCILDETAFALALKQAVKHL